MLCVNAGWFMCVMVFLYNACSNLPLAMHTSLVVISTGVPRCSRRISCASMVPCAPSMVTLATSAFFKNSRIHAFPARISLQSMDSTNTRSSIVFAATDRHTLVPSWPYLMPTNSFPLSCGMVSDFSSSHSALDIADLRLYLSHNPKRCMLKSSISSPISSATLLSVKMVPKDGLHMYHASLSRGSVFFSTPHSAQPVFSVSPDSAALRSLVNTVPLDIGVGGVPQKSVCGFKLSVTTYFSALCWSSVYSCASSMMSRSNPSPRPPRLERVRKSIFPPVFLSRIDSMPNVDVVL